MIGLLMYTTTNSDLIVDLLPSQHYYIEVLEGEVLQLMDEYDNRYLYHSVYDMIYKQNNNGDNIILIIKTSFINFTFQINDKGSKIKM